MTTNKPDAIVEKLEAIRLRMEAAYIKTKTGSHFNALQFRIAKDELDSIITTLKQPATIDEAVVERGANALADIDLARGFEHLRDKMMPKYREYSRAVLTAAGFKMEGR